MRRNTTSPETETNPSSEASTTRELTQIQQDIRNARRVSTPLIAVATPDQEATLAQICDLVRERSPVFSHDTIRGLIAQNAPATASLPNLLGGEQQQTNSRMLPWTLMNAPKVDQDGILVVFNAHRFIEDPVVSQGIANLRDIYKANRRCVILLGPHFNNLPEELQQDVVVFQEPLPSASQLREIVDRVYEAASSDMPDIFPADDGLRQRAVDATRGLSAFSAEQAIAMATNRSGISVPALWGLKRAAIEKVPGIKFWRGSETYESIGGLEGLKAFFVGLFSGPCRPAALVWMDEIEKSVHAGSAGSQGDTSGVSQDALKTLLSMEDEGWTGSILIGPPGTAKSLIAKATGNTFEVPTLAVDLGACKGSLVGQSEARIRAVLKTIRAIAGENVFFIATCLAEDTVVACGDGSLIPISQAAREGRSLVSLRLADGNVFDEVPSAHLATRARPVLLVKTSASHIRATPDHRFFRFDGGKIVECRTDQLQRGDFIAAPYTLPHGTDPINPEIAYLVGYTTGDGNVQPRRLQWSEEDPEQAERVASLCEEIFGQRAAIHPRKEVSSHLIYLQHPEEAQGFFLDYPEALTTGQHLRSVPQAICKGDAESVKAFLQGLYDAEGHALLDGDPRVELGTTSATLAHQVIMLLQRFSLLATLQYEDRSDDETRYDAYKVVLCGHQALAFMDYIGFRMSKKQNVRYTWRVPKETTYNVDCVPVDWNVILSLGVPVRTIFGQNRPQSIHRDRLKYAVEQIKAMGCDTSQLEQWLAYRWLKVKGTEADGTATVYDLTMPTEHNFVAAGTLVHNCNQMSTLPPELKRRLPIGPWFVDLPDEAQKESIWQIQMAAFGIDPNQPRPDDTHWSGADIRNCCKISRMLQRSLVETARMIIPIAVQDSTALEQLRTFANNRFLSASNGLPYSYIPESRGDAPSPQLRRITGDEDEEPVRIA